MAFRMLASLPNAFCYRLALDRGLSDRCLKAFVEEGVLVRLGHGVYRKTDAPPADFDRIEVALRAPEATLCLTSALSLHDLTDAIPSAVDIALPRSKRPPRVSAPVHWHRFHEETFHIGRETLEVDKGVTLGLYNAERSVIDAFRLGHSEGKDLAVEALKRWLKRRGAAPARLLAMARYFPKAEPSLLQALRILS
jgi:predicted transcriptional regulator of viral defense system